MNLFKFSSFRDDKPGSGYMTNSTPVYQTPQPQFGGGPYGGDYSDNFAGPTSSRFNDNFNGPQGNK